MTKIEKLHHLIGVLRDEDKSGPGPKTLPDEILVGVLLWGDLQCLPNFTVKNSAGTIQGIPVRPSKGLHTQSWALIYNYR